MKLLTKLWWFILGALGGRKWRSGRFYFWSNRGQWFDTSQHSVNLQFGSDAPRLDSPYSSYLLKVVYRKDLQVPIELLSSNARCFYAAYPGGEGEYNRGDLFSVEKTLPLGEHPWKGVISTWWRMWKILPG